MSRYYFNLINANLNLPTHSILCNEIFNDVGTEGVQIWIDNLDFCFYVSCDKKPKDMVYYGIVWKKDLEN